MPGQIAKNKKQISLVLDIDQIKRLDGRAAEAGRSRASLIAVAIDMYLDGPREEVAVAKLDAIAARLDAMDAAQKVAAAGLKEAIESVPVPALDAVADGEGGAAGADAWKSKPLLDRILRR